MPMVPEAAVAMLACARIGAVHSVIFGGFSPEAVAGRIIDSNSRLVITSDEGVRAGRSIPLKKNVDDALKNPNVTSVEHVVVLKRTGGKIDWQEISGRRRKRPGREQKNTGVRYRRLFKAFCRLWCSECGKRIQ